MNTRVEETIPKRMRPICEAILAIADAFCKEHLNGEYAELCRKLVVTLGRKRSSPFAHGEAKTWACSVVYAIGRVNFLTDKSQSPHMSTARLCELFGVGKSTASAKAHLIMNTLGMILLDPRWCLRSRLADNPLTWMLKVNGLMMDIRCAPREAQEEAFRLGLIPYVPSEVAAN
jgi:hypothetical protein